MGLVLAEVGIIIIRVRSIVYDFGATSNFFGVGFVRFASGDPFAGLLSTNPEGGEARPEEETTVQAPGRACAEYCCASSTAETAFR